MDKEYSFGDMLREFFARVPGVQFSEAVPNLAKAANKLTIVRSICHKDPNHGGGNHYMMTGMPTPVPVACGAFVTFHPSFGSMASYSRRIRSGMPACSANPIAAHTPESGTGTTTSATTGCSRASTRPSSVRTSLTLRPNT